jgi:hypothetical protein
LSLWVFFADARSRRAADDKQPMSNRLPTATEVFDLRSKCAAMGEKIMEDNVIGPALGQEQVSHYSPTSNRCYVKLEVHTGDLSTPLDKFVTHTYLYDGQTKELLASTSITGNSKTGMFFEDMGIRKMDPNPSFPTFDEVDAIINKFMAEDRKP